MRDEISEELRKWAAAHTPVKLGYQLVCGPVEEVIAIADRIDREMVELPKGADKKTIKPNQTVYSKLGKKYNVLSVPLCRDGWTVRCEPEPGEFAEFVPDSYFPPEDLTHECPDSLECIADELDEMVRGDHTVESFAQDWERLHELCQRIRKQMKELEHE